MRVLIFHGYLLGGTGSNVYNARLAPALVHLGHEVHLLCQDRHPEEHEFVDAVGEWSQGTLHVRELRPASPDRPGRCTVYRPDIGDLLPVYVADRYEGIEAKLFADCSEEEIERYIAANVAAVRDVVELVRPDVALANHLIMGPAILARALGGEAPDRATQGETTQGEVPQGDVPGGEKRFAKVPYAVKVHGSALEYTVKPHPERFLGFAREGIAAATAVLVGSSHTAQSLWEAIGDPALPGRTRLGPPGVDVEHFRPRGERGQAGDPLVVFVGKLILNKGVDLLIAAWPLVLASEPRARLLIVGFGTDRGAFERLLDQLASGDLEQARAGARTHLRAFLQSLSHDNDDTVAAERERYIRAARALPERVILTGRLEHEELADVLPACEALIVPSTFPEAFGMVAAEGAACGAFPIGAAHSGLAEVSETLATTSSSHRSDCLRLAIDDPE